MLNMKTNMGEPFIVEGNTLIPLVSVGIAIFHRASLHACQTCREFRPAPLRTWLAM
jgi:hypothetical protein